MAGKAQNIFEQYGIKEVADVQFEALEKDSRLGVEVGDIVMYLDTLKVSTIETTADQTEAKGGKGAPPLIIWDFGKEITVNLQDALFTPTSLAVMTGAAVRDASSEKKIVVRTTEERVLTENELTTVNLDHTPKAGDKVRYINLTQGKRGQVDVSGKAITTSSLAWTAGDRVRFFYDVEVDNSANDVAYEISINAGTFPGTYKVFGDTLVRNRNGKDTPYQFVLERAKVGSETTFTMEAEGDPSVFDMSLRVLRADDGSMIKFIKYELEEPKAE